MMVRACSLVGESLRMFMRAASESRECSCPSRNCSISARDFCTSSARRDCPLDLARIN